MILKKKQPFPKSPKLCYLLRYNVNKIKFYNIFGLYSQFYHNVTLHLSFTITYLHFSCIKPKFIERDMLYVSTNIGEITKKILYFQIQQIT